MTTNKTTGDKSKYAQKRASGKMMYGPGCGATLAADDDPNSNLRRARSRKRDSMKRVLHER